MMAILLSLLLASWQTTATIELKGRSPGVCGIRYADTAAGLQMTIEKRNTGSAVLTAFAVTGEGVRSARLVTANVDTLKLLKRAEPRPGEALRAEAVLENQDAGALLIHDLAISGGRLDIQRRGRKLQRYELPHPLPREVVTGYLNCAGDLVIAAPAGALP